MHIAADPVDENIVYVLNVTFMKSIDGGVTFEKMSAPHGDFHDHWINPNNNKNMINANDGGATITFDGGESWSSIVNQPTAQFYRVNTDNQFPVSNLRWAAGQLHGCNPQRDVRRRHRQRQVTSSHVGGGESAHIAFDPE